jgi:hypothetical protein
MQTRKSWGAMLDEDFDPWAIADTRPMPFKKSMEGAGIDAPLESRRSEEALERSRIKQNRLRLSFFR